MYSKKRVLGGALRSFVVGLIIGTIIVIIIQVLVGCMMPPKNEVEEVVASQQVNCVFLDFGYVNSRSGNSPFMRCYDRSAGVFCWIYYDNQRAGVSCLPKSQTLLGD